VYFSSSHLVLTAFKSFTDVPSYGKSKGGWIIHPIIFASLEAMITNTSIICPAHMKHAPHDPENFKRTYKHLTKIRCLSDYAGRSRHLCVTCLVPVRDKLRPDKYIGISSFRQCGTDPRTLNHIMGRGMFHILFIAVKLSYDITMALTAICIGTYLFP